MRVQTFKLYSADAMSTCSMLCAPRTELFLFVKDKKYTLCNLKKENHIKSVIACNHI